MEGATASGWLEVRYIAAGVASRQAQAVIQCKGMEMSFCFFLFLVSSVGSALFPPFFSFLGTLNRG